MKLLWGYCKKYRLQVILGPFSKLLEALLELLNPILMAKIIDTGIKTGDKGYILKYCIIILVCNILGFGFAIICQKCAAVCSAGIASQIRNDMYKKLNDYSHHELDNYGTSSLVTRITNDVTRIKNLISMLIRIVARTPCLLIGSLILSIFINPKLSLTFCVILPITIFILIWFTKYTLPFFKIIREKVDAVSRLTRENLSGVRVIRAFNHQDEENKRFYTANHGLTVDSIKISKITSLLRPAIFLLVDFAIIAVLYFGGLQVNVGSLTQGELIAFCNYFSTISVALMQISHIYISIVNSSASWHRIEQILEEKITLDYKDEPIKIVRRKSLPVLEFKNVSFSYDIDEQDIDRMFIKNLSLKLMNNETIGIIGPTGSGKSTIVNLIARFYDCNQGEVLLYGRNIKEYPKSQLRHLISITQQRSNLFSGSLRDNMKLRNENATDREIIKALKIAQAWEFVKDFSNTLDYQIMAGGKNVSGGQKQRLTIARSLIDDPDLLILDDASSALDFLTDLNLRKALIANLKCATVIVSQRASTIKNADLIIVMDNGKVVGMGKHADLIKNCTLYKETYKSQTQREI